MALLTDVLGRVISGRSRASVTFGKLIDLACDDDGNLWVSPTATPGDKPLLGGDGQKSVVMGNDDTVVIPASSVDLVMGVPGGGAAGDYLDHVLLSVAAAGTVIIKDGATTKFTHAFTAAVAVPVDIEIHALSSTGAWKITTPVGVSGVGIGVFT